MPSNAIFVLREDGEENWYQTKDMPIQKNLEEVIGPCAYKYHYILKGIITV